MPIQWQTIDIPLGAGLASGIDPKLVQPGQLIDVLDMYQDRQGELRKRAGSTVLSTGITPSGGIVAGKELVSDGSNLLLNDGSKIYSYGAAINSWLAEGFDCPFDCSAKVLSSNLLSEYKYRMASATVSNHTFIAYWSDTSNETVAKVVDATTGNEITNFSIGNVGPIHVFPLPGASPPVVGIVYSDKYRTYTPSTRVLSGTVAIIADKTADDRLSACAHGTSNFVVAYANNTVPAGEYISVRRHDSAGNSLGVYANQVSAGNIIYNTAVAYGPVAGKTYVTAYTADQVLTGYVLTNDALTRKEVLDNVYAVAPDHFVAAIIEAEEAAAYVYASHAPAVAAAAAGGRGFRSELRTYRLLPSAASTKLATSYNHLLHSSPLKVGTTYFVITAVLDISTTPSGGAVDTSPESGLYLCDQYGRIYGRFFPGEIFQPSGVYSRVAAITIATNNPEMPASPIDQGSNVYKFHLIQDLGISGTSLSQPTGQLIELTLDFGISVPRTSTIAKNMAFLPHKGVSQFDGKNLRIAGFHFYPATISATAGAGAGSIDAGVISVVAVYEWIDEKGNLYISAASRAETVTTTAVNDTITVEWPCAGFGLDTHIDHRVKLYRTLADGTIYYLAENHVNPGVGFHTSTLTEADALVGKFPVLYTTGGVLSNLAPPTPVILASDNEHMYAVPSTDRIRIWESKPLARLGGVDFTDALILDVPEGGDITGIAFLDGTKVIFKSRQIRYFSGNGHDNLGLGGYTQDKLLVNGLGCDEPRSIVKTPVGVLFKSQKGFYLLGRDLRPQYIGQPVESYDNETVLNATVVEEEQEVRFLITYGASSRVLVLNYQDQSWAVFTTFGTVSSKVVVDAALWSNKYVQLTSDGIVYVEDTTVFSDNSVGFNSAVETPWIKLSGLAGYQRIRRFALLGEYRAAFTVDVKVYYDYDPTVAQTFSAVAPIGTPSAGDPFYFRGRPTKQKCKAIKFSLTINSTTTEGLRLTGLSLEVGVKSGLDRLSSDLSK